MLIHHLRRWPNGKTTLTRFLLGRGCLSNTIHRPNVKSMLVHRWPNIDITLGVMFAGGAIARGRYATPLC